MGNSHTKSHSQIRGISPVRNYIYYMGYESLAIPRVHIQVDACHGVDLGDVSKHMLRLLGT